VAITADWQIELPGRSLLMGAGTSYKIRSAAGLSGVLDTPTLRTDDLPRTGVNGTTLGRVYADFRVLSWRLGVDDAQASTVGANVKALLEAWRAPSDASEVALDVRVPGTPETVLRYYGQPRSVQATTSAWGHGLALVEVDCEFFASDPFAYGAEVTVTSGAGATTLSSASLGDLGADTVRATITLSGTGGTPIVSSSTSGGVIVFSSGLGATQVAEINLRTGEVTVNSTSTPAILATSTSWITLLGGQANTLHMSGAGSVTYRYRPAYW
jgi:hypothetical protein